MSKLRKWLPVFFYVALIPFLFLSVYLSSYFPLKGEVHITNDVGRDFLLLQELDEKKIVLIGARSNAQGVFHGPFWTYLNYPAYLIGHGNPVTIAWFWVILGIFFLITTFLLIRKFFGTFPAALAILLLSVDYAPHINSVIGPEAMFFFMPVFLFTIYQYIVTKKTIYLFLHFITVAIFIHLNIGVGILYAFLSIFLGLFLIFKNRSWKHILAFVSLPIFTSNFLFFDLRHNFLLTKSLFHVGGNSKFLIPFNSWIWERINSVTSLELLYQNIPPLVFIIFLMVLLFTYFEIKNGKNKNFFLLILFYYFGYALMGYFNKGVILFHYTYLLMPLSVIWLVSLIRGKYKYFIVPAILVITFLNLQSAYGFVKNEDTSFINKSPNSWIALESVGKEIIKEQDKNKFGYFVYSPDSFAYQQRYSMLYLFKAYGANASEYVKEPVTYLIITPPPQDKPYMLEDWWIENEAKIAVKPVEKKKMGGGYKIEKFLLTEEEQKIPHDKNIEIYLHFR